MKKYILLLSLILALVSCEEDTDPFNFAPELATGEATGLYRKGATVNGSIRRVNGCKVAECGIMYSTFSGMADAQTQTVDNSTEGDFTVALTGLIPGTTYYYCTYASSGYSTAKGEIREFRTPSNTGPVFGHTQVTNLPATSVGVSVTLEDDGGTDLILSGYVYKQVDSEEDNGFKFGEEGTNFSQCEATDYRTVLKDLVPGKMYGIRPYGKSSEDGYGEAVFVTMNTTSVPALSSCALSDTTEAAITVSARILSEGTSVVTERGFCYSMENATPTERNLTVADEGATADMTAVLTNLRSRAKYYIRAYAKNDEGYGYGEVIEYVVPEHTVLEVETSQVTDITSSSAKLYGHITANNVTVKSCGFCWSTENTTPNVDKDSKYEMSTKAESFATVLTGLSFGKTYYFRAFAVNEKDEVYYGAVMSFVTTDIQLPSVTTSAATDITETSARVSGSITSDGNGTVSAKGFCWSTTNASPTVSDSKHEVSGEGTSFATVLTGLVPGQRYYVRFYAVNEKGTAYGETVEFTTVKTDAPVLANTAVTEITQTSARASSSVTSDGGADITEKGFCISSTNANPTVGDRKIAVPTSAAAFNAVIDGLTEGTTYHIRSYAVNKNGTSYGAVHTFTTVAIERPSVTTSAATDITETSARVSGSITSDGNGTVSAKGFCWSTTNAAPTVSDSKHEVSGEGTSFATVLTGLAPGQRYYVRFYAANEKGTAYGETVEFTTVKTDAPVLAATTVVEITQTSARASSSVTSDGGADITEKGFCISSTNANPTVGDRKIAVPTSAAAFNVVIDNLVEGTTYHIRSYAVNKNGTSYGAVHTFTTVAIGLPSVTTSAATDITETSARVSGSITSDGNGTVSSKGFCWSTTNTAPTVSDSKHEVSGEGTSFATVLTGLAPGQRYYVRFYVANEKGTAYGETVEFTTVKTDAPVLANTAVTEIAQTSARASSSVTSDGGADITEKGFCISSTNANPTVGDRKIAVTTTADAFNVVIDNLVEGTTYHIRSYAVNKNGTSYGAVHTFTTVKTYLPTLSATMVSDVTASSATVTSAVTSDGGAEITEQGFCYATVSMPTTADNVIKTTGGNMTVTITGLAEETRFYVRSYAVNKNGTSYGEVTSFVTDKTIVLPSLSEVTTGSITPNSFAVSASVVSDGNGTVSEQGFCFVKGNVTPTVNDNKVMSSGNGASLSATVDGLEASTAYTVCAYARNEKEVAYSAPVTVVTKKADPSEDDIVYPGKQ